MKKLNKTLSVLLTFVMLFTTFCFFPLDLGAVEADAAIAGIKIVVPETIYLTPSTGASTAGQYYVNNNADGSVKTAYDTTASVSVTYPGATLKSVSAATTAAANIGAITGLNGTTLGSSAATASSAITLGAGLNAGGTALVEWTFVFDVNGETQTHYAYSVAYAPWYQPVGAAAKAKGAWHNTFASSILWVSGVHGYSDGDSNNRWYVQTANFIPMLGTIKAPTNNNPDTNWIQSGSNGLSPTINYQETEAGGTKYHARANSISPTANLTVDTSRYNNFNQIPNFRVGFMVTDREGTNDSGSNQWYVSDFTGQTSSYYNGTATGGSQYTGDWDSSGTKFSEGSDRSAGVKYNSTWNKAISGTASFRIKSAVKSMYKATITSTGWNNNFVNISVTGANKGTLRTKVMEGTSYAKENYTADTWSTYQNALKAAATNLGNPTSATVDTTALTEAENALHTTAYFDANGGTLGSSTPASIALQIGTASTLTFNNADIVGSFNATRTGYTFLGWSTEKDATTAPASFTIGFNDTVYAVWEANEYNVVFDNLFDFSNFNIGTGKLEINERTATGFTVTSTDADGADANTGFSTPIPVEPGKTYIVSADVAIECDAADVMGYDIYINTLNANKTGDATSVPDTSNGAHTEGDVYISLTGQKTETKPYISFTAGETTAYITIRFDANTAGNKLTVNNIRVYEVGTVADGVSYEAPLTVTYDSTYSAIPTPTRENYRFLGWYTAPNGGGTKISATDTVKITETTHLYSHWTDANYYIAFDANTGSGTMDTLKANVGENYTLPANTFTKTGYNFLGWALDKSATAATYSDKAAVQLAEKVSTVTLYAVWAQNDYTINYIGGDGVTGNTEPQAVKYDETVTLRNNGFNKTGYIFSGWTDGTNTYSAGQELKNLTAVHNGTVTLTAVWTPITYTVSFDIPGADIEAITVTYDEAADRLPDGSVFNKDGFTFGGWVVSGTDTTVTNDNYDTLVTVNGGSVTLKAVEVENSYTVEFDGNTNTSGETASQTVKYTDSFALNANGFEKIGYTFMGWAESADGEVKYSDKATDISKLTTEVNGKVTLYAVWEANTYTVIFNNNDSSATGTMSNQKFTYDEAKTLDKLGFSKEGYHFVEWNTSADGNGTSYNDNEEVINLTADVDGEFTLYAIWTINLYDVTFKFYDFDGTEVTVTREDVPHGTDFDTLLPTEAEDFIKTYFDGSKAMPEDNTCHYNFLNWENKVAEITADVTFTAVYAQEKHVYYAGNAAKAATCTETGIKAEYCLCGYEYEEVISALGHQWVETGRSVGCTTDGTIEYKCSRANCSVSGGATKQETLEATGHVFSDVVTRQEPTCTEVGFEAYKTCTVCKLYFAENAEVMDEGSDTKTEISASGHKYGDWIAEVPATCEGEGTLGHYTCSVCKVNFDADEKELSSLVIEAKGHDYGGWIAEVPATCEGEGTLGHYTCSVCQTNFDENKAVLESLVINATGHNYEGKVTTYATCITDGVMTYTCKNNSAHTYEDVIKAEGHKFTNEVEYKAPECEKEGNEAYKSCSVCNKYFAASEDAFSENAKDSTDAFTLVATGHTQAKKQETITEASCTVAGDYWDITYCSVCDKELDRVEVTGQTLPHTYTEELINSDHLKSDATCTLYAVYYYDCVYCDANAKDAADKDAYTFEYVAGGYNAENHVGTTTTADEDIVAGTCNSNKTWNEVTRCDDCKEIITSEPKTGENDKNNHVGKTEIRKEDVKAGTCTTAETWNDVTYCLDCKNAINTEAKTGETNPANHSTDVTVLKDDKVATCCEEGFTGNMRCVACDAIVTPGTVISKNKDNHVGGTRTEKEDVVAGTCMKEETWNNVTYCVGCGDKLKTEPMSGEKNSENHTGNNTVTKTDEIAGTCKTAATWTEVTTCECGKTIKTEAKTGEKDPANHTGNNTVTKTDEVAGTCKTAATWTEVTTCECGKEIKTEAKTGEKNPENHTGETNIKAENIVLGTCVSEKTWDEVTYCECGKKLGTVAKTGEKDENNHTGAADKTVGYIAPTCKNEGYTGDTYYSCCNKFYATGTAISTIDHTPDKAVKENEIPATETEDGSYDSVVYCSVCRHEISREKIITKVERTITFVMKDKTVTVKAYNGDTVALPDVADFVGADGFIHKFKSWDKPVAVVNGDAQYTAIYTEPADWSDLDRLEETLKEVLEGDYADDAVIEENKEKIEEVLGMIETINSERNTLDKDSQSRIDFVAGEIGGLIDIIYPDAGSTLVIEGSSVVYAGTILDLKAIKMPLGAVLTDAQWVSSDDNVVFFSNGKLYAIGTGTVTLTATRGILKASKTVTVIEGGNTRGINFTSINNTHFIIEDYAAVYNSAIIYWSDDFDLRFRVRVYQSFMFEDYIVYINGVEVEPNADGYYVVPAGSGDARVTIAGAMIDTGAGDGEVVTKWSFWEWLLSLFRKIADFFRGIFG